eukprot:1147877-Pelagomonas_calceolata.AAC.1
MQHQVRQKPLRWARPLSSKGWHALVDLGAQNFASKNPSTPQRGLCKGAESGEYFRGKAEKVILLVKEGNVAVDTVDSWGHTPEGDARLAGHHEVAQYLQCQEDALSSFHKKRRKFENSISLKTVQVAMTDVFIPVLDFLLWEWLKYLVNSWDYKSLSRKVIHFGAAGNQEWRFGGEKWGSHCG